MAVKPEWALRRGAALGSAALLLLLLGACSDEIANGPDSGVIDARALCVSQDCGERQQIVDLPQLENQLFTSKGRLFVSGQENLYEIMRAPSGTYGSRALFPEGGGCSGLAEYKGLLYALCPGGLHALRLDDPAAVPVLVTALVGMTLPNGMVVGPQDRLYITDGPVALSPKIICLQLDPQDPLRVLSQTTWLSTLPEFPNGLAIRGNSLYTTLYVPPLGTVARIDIQADGSAGPIARLVTRGILDDLSVVGDTLLITDWQAGAVFQTTLDGERLQGTGLLSFLQPSSVGVAGPPVFDEPTVLVTERYLGRGLWAWQPR